MSFSLPDINLLEDRLGQLIFKLQLANLKEQQVGLEEKSSDASLWSDEQKAKEVLQELSRVKNLIAQIEDLQAAVSTLIELSTVAAEDVGLHTELETLFHQTTKKIDKLEVLTFLSGKYDHSHAILSIHSGQGGTEAMDWASMLERMYIRFFERRGWGFEMIDRSVGEEAGIKAVTFIVRAPYAFGYLKHEKGTHRLVRLSPFNADSLRQTSFAGVEVSPVIEEVGTLTIRDEDLDFEATRSGGAGGQNVNKVSTAVRIRHIPTGIVVTCQTQRSQEQNRKFAMQLLMSKLWEIEETKRNEELASVKGEYRQASFGNQIRSYVLHPYKLVKDLRTNYESTDPDSVLDGQLDEFLDRQLKLLIN